MKKNHLLSPAYIMLILFSCAAIARQVYDFDHPNDPPPPPPKLVSDTIHYITSDNLSVSLTGVSTALSGIINLPKGGSMTQGLGNCPNQKWVLSDTFDKKSLAPTINWFGASVGGARFIPGLPNIYFGCDNNYYTDGHYASMYFNFTPVATIAVVNSGYNHYQKVHSDAPVMMPYGNPGLKLYWKADVEWWYPDIIRKDTGPGRYRCDVTVNVYYQLYNNVGDNPGQLGTVSNESGHSDRQWLNFCQRV